MTNHLAAVSCALVLFLSSACFCQDSCQTNLNFNYGNRDATQHKLQLSSASGGKLYYFGAVHLNETKDAQFSEIQKAWNSFTPTIAFFEGPDRGIADSDTATIREFGESGYVRFLAKSAGIKAMTLEPPPTALFKYLTTQMEQQQVELFFLLGEAMRLRTRKHYNPEQIDKAVTEMIKKMQAIAGDSMLIRSIPDLEKLYKHYWPNGPEWWQAPQAWFDPAKDPAETGGLFTNKVNRLSSAFRDIYMYQQLSIFVNKGEKVFAVVGRDHVVTQFNALRCAIR
ncbi:hypothetical protein LZZ85_17065 [Terrimonas sp. NA20]|uniref:TraB/GumN family protein n=1 Tax=Terrimonas ginsenosidimutans TaxID=2908004 RepID=A0ABS9KUK6_9BACT|nr:hypothetical protein [Terrimonas ginsenosidimutans]MCG2616011.1 hypothetical protein [Terrimonas ginsenosidimutans]